MGEDRYGIEMTTEEIAEFLTRRGHGVLSFGGDTPYGLPMSFGYDVMDNRCIFQLVFDDASRKRAYIEDSDSVSLVVYEWTGPDDWRSVVVEGQLQEIENDTPDAVQAEVVFGEYATVVGLSVFNEPIEELEPEWYELQIEEMTGYQSPLERSRDQNEK